MFPAIKIIVIWQPLRVCQGESLGLQHGKKIVRAGNGGHGQQGLAAQLRQRELRAVGTHGMVGQRALQRKRGCAAVSYWCAGVHHQIDAPGRTPRWCTSEQQALPRLADLPMHLAAFDTRVSVARHSAWLALDPSRWILSCHQLWCGEQPPPARHAAVYEVAHFSQPR